jgi:hypothetical protein
MQTTGRRTFKLNVLKAHTHGSHYNSANGFVEGLSLIVFLIKELLVSDSRRRAQPGEITDHQDQCQRHSRTMLENQSI